MKPFLEDLRHKLDAAKAAGDDDTMQVRSIKILLLRRETDYHCALEEAPNE